MRNIYSSTLRRSERGRNFEATAKAHYQLAENSAATTPTLWHVVLATAPSHSGLPCFRSEYKTCPTLKTTPTGMDVISQVHVSQAHYPQKVSSPESQCICYGTPQQVFLANHYTTCMQHGNLITPRAEPCAPLGTRCTWHQQSCNISYWLHRIVSSRRKRLGEPARDRWTSSIFAILCQGG